MAVDRKISDFSDVGNPKILLEETFYVLSRKNTVFRVQLSANGLCLLKESSDIVKKQTISIKDIIGCQCMRSKRRSRSAASCVCQSLPRTPALKVVDENSSEQDETDTSAYLYIYAYILQNSRRGLKKRERTIITLRFRSFDKYEDNNKEAQRWRSVIKNLMNGQNILKTPSLTESIPPSFNLDDRKLLIFLNPKSGPGKGRLLFQQRVVPVLQEAEMQFDLHITKYANYAREFVRTNNLFNWKGIVVIGGDGILFEILNGIFERPDWIDAIQKIPFGIVPCGSGNGLARTIAHCYNEPFAPNPVLAAALTVVRKNTSPMDLVRVETKSQIIFSFLSVGWGLIADIDIESERFRAIGGQRFTVGSVARLLDLRTYKGKLWYLPIGENIQITAIPQTDSNNCENNIPEEVNLETTDATVESRQRLDSWYSATSRRSAYFSATGSNYQSMIDSTNGEHHNSHGKVHMYGPASQLPALIAPIPSHWTYIEGNFIMVHASYQTHLGEDCFFAPNSRLNDGIIWLAILHAGLSRSQLLSFLLALSSGTHLDLNYDNLIEMVAVRAFRLEPEEGTNSGHITVDGELVEYGSIQAEIFPGLASIMVP